MPIGVAVLLFSSCAKHIALISALILLYYCNTINNGKRYSGVFVVILF